MEHERRRAERVKVNLGVHWEAEKGRCEGTLSDLSINGCFVLCASQVNDGELVRLEILMPRKKIMVLWGVVTNHLDEIGFGMKFTSTDVNETKRLKRMVARATEKNAAA
jgi:hypothetical protein